MTLSHITFSSTLRRLRQAAWKISALALCAGAAHAQDKTLYIGMNGGDMERSYTKYVFPAFERIHGVKVVVVSNITDHINLERQRVPRPFLASN